MVKGAEVGGVGQTVTETATSGRSLYGPMPDVLYLSGTTCHLKQPHSVRITARSGGPYQSVGLTTHSVVAIIGLYPP